MAETVKKTRMSRAISALLFLSVVFNFVIVGAFLGFMLRPNGVPMHDRGSPPLRDLGFGAYSSALPKEDRRMLLQEMSGVRDQLRDSRALLKKQMEELAAVLSTEPFDPAKMNAIMEAQEQVLLERQRLGRRLFVDHVSRMPEERRNAYAERIAAMSQRMGAREGAER
ncbi:MAG: periplasmic heavy metal sensor [Paracoccaceae bacterium]|nr:periplasmic heavy metal sensor [Paracoccaceae bacterium]